MKKLLIDLIDSLFWFLSPYGRGEMLFQIHYWGFLVLVVSVILYGQKRHLAYFLVFLLVVLVLFRVWNGCLLTQMEKYYRKKDETIVDGFLRMIGIPVSNASRTSITLGGLILIFGYTILLYVRLYINAEM
jgi:hypothetical protein